MDIEARTLNAGVLSLKTSLTEAVAALDKDGILLLKEATDLSSVESALTRDVGSFDGFRSDIVLHKAVKAILFVEQQYDFKITGYLPNSSQPWMTWGRDMEWRELAEKKGIAAVSCIHLGGGSEVEWCIEIDEGSRGEATGRSGIVKANGGDIIICNHWLRRTLPRTLRPNFSKPFIAIPYRRADLERGVFYPEGSIDKAMEELGDECNRSGNFIIWKK